MICKHILLITEPELFLYSAKWFQVLLCNSHNLTSVICLPTVCSTWPNQMLPLRVREDLRAMAMKRYTIYPISPRLEPCLQMV